MVEFDLIVQIVANGILIGLLLALSALGLSLIFGVSGVINIAHGEFIMLAGYVTFFGFTLYGVNPIVSMALTLPLGAILGYGVYRLLIKGIMDRPTVEEDSLLITFGVSSMLINAARIQWSTDIRGYQFLPGSYSLAGITLPKTQIVAGLLALVLYGIVYAILRYGKVGRAIRATAQNRDQAKRVGIRVQRIDAITFTLASALAAASGTLLSMVYTVTPRVGFNYVLDSFVIVVLGGLGSIIGSLVAALIFSLTRQFGTFYYTQTIGQILSMSLIFIVFFFRPQGLFGRGGQGGK